MLAPLWASLPGRAELPEKKGLGASATPSPPRPLEGGGQGGSRPVRLAASTPLQSGAQALAREGGGCLGLLPVPGLLSP